jgi:hypothetical protein
MPPWPVVGIAFLSLPPDYEIIGDHHCGFQHNTSTTEQVFCSHGILDNKWEYNETVHQLFLYFKKASGLTEEGSIVQYSHIVWVAHDTIHAD